MTDRVGDTRRLHRRGFVKSAGTAVGAAITSGGGLTRVASADSTEPPGIRWVRAYGGEEGERNRDLVRTDDGGFALVGYTRSTDAETPTRSWLVKVDSDGDVEWSRDYAWGIFDSILTVDDGYVIGGGKNGQDGGMWLLKTDADGRVDWSKTFGSSDGWMFTVEQLADGGFICGGSAIVKTDGDGTKQWKIDRSVLDVCATMDGGVVSVYGPSLTKLTAAGDPQWQTTFIGHERDDFYSVTQRQSGGFSLAGIVKSTPESPPRTRVVGTDRAGGPEWVVTLTPAGITADVIETSDGGLLVVGTTDEFRAVKLAANGDRRWSAQYIERAPLNRARAVVELPRGGYAISGTSMASRRDDIQMVLVKTEAD